jgi:hypothetical protein
VLQVVQILGAIAILVGFAQFGVLDHRSYPYLVLNLVGAAVLAALAYVERQWGYSSCSRASGPSCRPRVS